MSGTEAVIIQITDGEVMGPTKGSAERSKLGGCSLVNSLVL